jgi:hypothetical protein
MTGRGGDFNLGGKMAANARRIEHSVTRDADGSREESWYDLPTGRDVERSSDPNGKPTDVWTIPAGKLARMGHLRGADVLGGSRAAVPPPRSRASHRRTGEPRQGLPPAGERRRARRRRWQADASPARARPHPRKVTQLRAVDYQLDTWVDPLTYVTVRARVSGHQGSSVRDVTWPARTPANLARLKLVIPRGFERLATTSAPLIEYSTATTSRRCAQ